MDFILKINFNLIFSIYLVICENDKFKCTFIIFVDVLTLSLYLSSLFLF